jgi:hypothetical protein
VLDFALVVELRQSFYSASESKTGCYAGDCGLGLKRREKIFWKFSGVRKFNKHLFHV